MSVSEFVSVSISIFVFMSVSVCMYMISFVLTRVHCAIQTITVYHA